jgi:hypothetical protein
MDATAQLNARMSQDLKSSGDQVLAEAGVSQTKLVRLVWQKVASGSEGLQQLLEVLQSGTHTQELAQVGTPTRAKTCVPRGEQLFAEGMDRLGLSQEAAERASATSNWKDLREEAIADRLGERGIL